MIDCPINNYSCVSSNYSGKKLFACSSDNNHNNCRGSFFLRTTGTTVLDADDYDKFNKENVFNSWTAVASNKEGDKLIFCSELGSHMTDPDVINGIYTANADEANEDFYIFSGI